MPYVAADLTRIPDAARTALTGRLDPGEEVWAAARGADRALVATDRALYAAGEDATWVRVPLSQIDGVRVVSMRRGTGVVIALRTHRHLVVVMDEGRAEEAYQLATVLELLAARRPHS